MFFETAREKQASLEWMVSNKKRKRNRSTGKMFVRTKFVFAVNSISRRRLLRDTS